MRNEEKEKRRKEQARVKEKMNNIKRTIKINKI